MTYDEALALIQSDIEYHEQYRVIPSHKARELMGETRYKKFIKDPIIGKGPSGYDGFFYWNVAAGMIKDFK